jgi:hypothetical protein
LRGEKTGASQKQNRDMQWAHIYILNARQRISFQ